MPPSNTSAAAATSIGALPYDFTQTDINDSGVNYTVWYKFTAPVNSRVIGAWGFSGNTVSGYRPRIIPYLGPSGSPSQIDSINFQNKPIQFVVTAGQEYFLKFESNLNDAIANTLRVRVEVAPTDTIDAGSIIVNDDTEGFPLAVLSPTTDYTVINFVPDIPAGEACDILSDGVMCFEDFANDEIAVYDKNFALLNSFAKPIVGDSRIRTCRTPDIFYLGSDSANPEIYSIDNTGTLSTLIATLTGAGSLRGMAAKNDQTVLYYSTDTLGSAIKRWDLINDVTLTDFAASDPAYYVTDILVLSDDKVVALYDGYFLGQAYVKVFNAAGTLLNTYFIDNTVHPAGTFCRAAYALDDPNSVWAWIHPEDGLSRFVNVKISDGSFLAEIEQAEYETGGYVKDETATPLARFGPSFSCAFMIMTDDSGPAPTEAQLTISKTVSPVDATVFNFTTSTNLSPSSFSLSNGENRVFTSLTPGTYAIVETANINYTTTYLVSNANPHTAIVLAAGDNVTVAVTNTLLPDAASGIYKIVPGKRNDTIYLNPNTGTTEDVKIPDPFADTAYIGN